MAYLDRAFASRTILLAIKAGERMKRGEGKEGQESPELLREIARRSRVIASAVPAPERKRILAYAKELDSTAASLEAATLESATSK
jgi:hypothetical protein